jgi:hypothetical protein
VSSNKKFGMRHGNAAAGLMFDGLNLELQTLPEMAAVPEALGQ